MKHWIILGLLILAQIWIVFVGISFHINVGDIQKNDLNLQYITTSRTIASFILASNHAEILCENKSTICTQVINPDAISPFMPIQLEACKNDEQKKINLCNKPQLKLNLDTSKWIHASLGRRL